MHLTFDEFRRYTQEQRDTWRAWFVAHPDAMSVELQPGGRYPTVGSLIDHIFLVERRHLQRLRGAPLDSKTGLSGLNAPPLFDYGASVRRELEHYTQQLDDDVAEQVRTIAVKDREVPMSIRKLLFHILLHETRHWAQIALAVRLAGFEPPGDHDLFYSKALR
jgi:uncharacterized damage-inducible protein DinB